MSKEKSTVPTWVPIPLDYERWKGGGSDVFSQSKEAIVAPLPNVRPTLTARQSHFEDMLRNIAWITGSDTIPVFLDFNGTRVRFDKGCLSMALGNGVIVTPQNSAAGYIEHVQLNTKDVTHAAPAGPALWQSYMREEIPPQFGLPFTIGKWQQTGFVVDGHRAFLLVTLDKAEFASAHQYDDGFVDDRHLQWQSQNRTRQNSTHGQLISQQVPGAEIHLFVRRQGKINGKAAPFTYFGALAFESWEGEQPITVQFSLHSPVPVNLHGDFRIGIANAQ